MRRTRPTWPRWRAARAWSLPSRCGPRRWCRMGLTVCPARPRVKGGANGNGNGHANGNGNGNGHSLAPAAPVSTHSLRVYLPRTSDFDADVDIMHKVDRVLRQSAGEDPVIIHMPNTDGTVV